MSDALPIGMMVVAGFERYPLEVQLEFLAPTGIRHVEIYPRWADDPAPEPSRRACERDGVTVHSVHGVWGRESYSGDPIDLGAPDEDVRRRSVDETLRSVHYAASVGAACLVVHPGVLSDESEQTRRARALRASIESLLPAAEDAGVRLCLENMPPRVCPGSRTRDLVDLIESIDGEHLGICLDTGHAHIVSSVAEEIRAAGAHLATTHVHDNNGSRDTHNGPFSGTVPWPEATEAWLAIGYDGPLILECVKWYHADPGRLNAGHLNDLRSLGERPA